MSDVVDAIVAKFGTQTELARLLGCDQSTISQWKARGGLIPVRQQQKILGLARARGVVLTLADFFPAPAAAPTKPKRKRAA